MRNNCTWEDWEINILKILYPVLGASTSDFLSWRTSAACRTMAGRVGARKKKYWCRKKLTKDGYIELNGEFARNHPLAIYDKNNRRYTVSEHRYVWWNEHPEDRQPMLDGATIHHKNGRRDDNKLENLQIRYKGKHPKGISLQDMADTLTSKGWTCTPPHIYTRSKPDRQIRFGEI